MSKARNVIDLPKSLWNRIGAYAVGRIREDASSGIFQNDKKNLNYKSESYERYKQNSMERFGIGPNKVRAGTKLGSPYVTKKGVDKKFKNSFQGIGTDTETSFVNMKLKGETLRRISWKAGADSVTLKYANGEIVQGNSKRGYELYDLRQQNVDKIADMIGKELDKNSIKYTKKDVTIKIG